MTSSLARMVHSDPIREAFKAFTVAFASSNCLFDRHSVRFPSGFEDGSSPVLYKE